MQKHSDRMDKRPPVNCAPGPGISGLGGAEYWPKLDMSALYQGYGAVAGEQQARLAAEQAELQRGFPLRSVGGGEKGSEYYGVPWIHSSHNR